MPATAPADPRGTSLSLAEERALFATMHDGDAPPESRRAARDTLITRNLPLAIKTAAGVNFPGACRDDVHGWSRLVLVKLVDKYRPDKGACFYTFARKYLRLQLLNLLAQREARIRTPHYLHYKRAAARKNDALHAAAAGAARRAVSYGASNDLDGHTDEGKACDWRPVADRGDVLEAEERREAARRRVGAMLGRLAPQDAEAVAAHLGLLGRPPEPHREVAARRGVTKQAVSGRYTDAMARLRALARDPEFATHFQETA